MRRFREKTTGLLTNVDLKGAKGKIIYWLFFAILITCCLLTFLPALWTVFMALKGPEEIYTSTSFFDTHKRIMESVEIRKKHSQYALFFDNCMGV